LIPPNPPLVKGGVCHIPSDHPLLFIEDNSFNNFAMSQTLKTSLFQKALEAVEALSLEDQAVLVDTINTRLKQHQHQKIVEEIAEVRQEYQIGNVKFGSVDDFLSELDN
jgi:hypothetical protein